MANPAKRLSDNAPGGLYVDATCIDCGTCRFVAPVSFTEGADHSYVYRQPEGAEAFDAAMRALVACPTASIGLEPPDPDAARRAMAAFPLSVTDGVAYMGFASPKSFGGASYLLTRPEGAWLIDAPRYHPALFGPIAAAGGLAGIFLTHRDDVADAARYAAHFKAPRWIHDADADAQPDAEHRFTGTAPLTVAPGCRILPTPGHSAGHSVMLVDDRVLFSGDHLWGTFAPGHAPGDAAGRRLEASRRVCWDSWEAQIRSMERLLEERFEWVLPGHGYPLHLPADEMQTELRALIARMKEAPPA
jgi:glyoxylase-like metal-dependent hydrolase (beta-lactamase superfamily II)/ferredoxin